MTHFSAGDDEETDHTMQKDLVSQIYTYFSQPQRFIELLFLVLLGLVSALLSLGITVVVNTAIDFQVRVASAAATIMPSAPPLTPPSKTEGVLASFVVMVGQLRERLADGELSGILGFVATWAISLCFVSIALIACLPPPHGPGSRHAVGSGIPEIKAILSGYWLARYLSSRALAFKVVGLSAALAGGYVIGREGPMVHLSAALSVLLMKLPFFESIDDDHQKKRAMLAAASAIGVVVTFGTPIGGVLFSVEVTATYYMVHNLWRSFVGAITAVLCFQALANNELVELVPTTNFPSPRSVGWELLAIVGLGAMQGVFSAIIVALMSKAAVFLKRQGWLRPVRNRFVTGLTVATVAVVCKFLLPVASRASLDLLADLFADTQSMAHAGDWSLCSAGWYHTEYVAGSGSGSWWCDPYVGLCLFCVMELFLHISSIVLPVPSGCFMPVFIIGAATGRLYGAALRRAFGYDHASLPDGLMAAVGAGALAAGTTHTLSTALVTVELISQQSLINPMLVAVIVSCGISGMLSKSIYNQILVLKGLPYMPHLRTSSMFQMTASDIMRPTASVIAAAQGDHDAMASVVSEVDGEPLSEANPYHPSKTKMRKLTGTKMERALAPLAYDMSVGDVLAACRLSKDRFIPLVESRSTPTLLGALTRAQLIEWFVIEVEIAMDEEANGDEEDGDGFPHHGSRLSQLALSRRESRLQSPRCSPRSPRADLNPILGDAATALEAERSSGSGGAPVQMPLPPPSALRSALASPNASARRGGANNGGNRRVVAFGHESPRVLECGDDNEQQRASGGRVAQALSSLSAQSKQPVQEMAHSPRLVRAASSAAVLTIHAEDAPSAADASRDAGPGSALTSSSITSGATEGQSTSESGSAVLSASQLQAMTGPAQPPPPPAVASSDGAIATSPAAADDTAVSFQPEMQLLPPDKAPPPRPPRALSALDAADRDALSGVHCRCHQMSMPSEPAALPRLSEAGHGAASAPSAAPAAEAPAATDVNVEYPVPWLNVEYPLPRGDAELSGRAGACTMAGGTSCAPSTTAPSPAPPHPAADSTDPLPTARHRPLPLMLPQTTIDSEHGEWLSPTSSATASTGARSSCSSQLTGTGTGAGAAEAPCRAPSATMSERARQRRESRALRAASLTDSEGAPHSEGAPSSEPRRIRWRNSLGGSPAVGSDGGGPRRVVQPRFSRLQSIGGMHMADALHFSEHGIEDGAEMFQAAANDAVPSDGVTDAAVAAGTTTDEGHAVADLSTMAPPAATPAAADGNESSRSHASSRVESHHERHLQRLQQHHDHDGSHSARNRLFKFQTFNSLLPPSSPITSPAGNAPANFKAEPATQASAGGIPRSTPAGLQGEDGPSGDAMLGSAVRAENTSPNAFFTFVEAGALPNLEAVMQQPLAEGVERWLGDLERPFPWDEIEWNRCALQLSAQTGLDEIHGIFSFMSMGQVWITSGGRLVGVVTDRALIAACLHGDGDNPAAGAAADAAVPPSRGGTHARLPML